MDKLKRLDNPHKKFSRDFAQLDFFQCTFFSELTVLDTATITQNKVYSLFEGNFFRFMYQLIWNTVDQPCLQNISNPFPEQDSLPFSIEGENVHPKVLV